MRIRNAACASTHSPDSRCSSSRTLPASIHWHLSRLRPLICLALFATSIPLSVQSHTVAQSSGANEPALYFFTNDHCPPCKQLEPVLLELARQGYPITRIDTHVHHAWVRKFQVASTPTVVFVADNSELARYAGFIDGRTIAGWFRDVGFAPGRDPSLAPNQQSSRSAGSSQSALADRGTFAHQATPQNTRNSPAPPERQITPPEAQSVSPYTLTGGTTPESEEEFIQEYTRRRQSDNLADADPTITKGTARPDNRIEADAMMATVRLRVEDPEGISYATGTVIHCHEGEWLILTCGHVFRDSNGTGDIHVDYDLASPSPRSARGQLLDYDSEDRDVALVAVKTGVDVRPIPIASFSRQVARGDTIFSLGCDHGQRPTIRRSRIKSEARYNGVIKYDIYGRPVDGRSGGGLFTPEGQLIGVCNAAAVEFDEGIYTALDSIYWQLETAGLVHLFDSKGRTSPYSLVADPAPVVQSGVGIAPSQTSGPPRPNDAPMTNVSSSNQLPQDSISALQRESLQPGRQPDGATIASGTARDAGWIEQRPLLQPQHPASYDSQFEVLVIVQPRSEPENARTIRLADPSPELLQYLEKVGNRQLEERSIDMARLRLPIERVRYR